LRNALSGRASICAIALWIFGAAQTPAVDFDSAIRRFDSSRSSQPFLFLENFLLGVRKPRQMRLLSLRAVSRDGSSNLLTGKFPKVSGRDNENSRFPETRSGDRGIKPLPGSRQWESE
jgi:hypothetical protein